MLVVTLQMLWKINILCCIRAPLRNRTNWCVCEETYHKELAYVCGAGKSPHLAGLEARRS